MTRFLREVAPGGFLVVRSGSRRLFVAFFGGAWLGTFVCLRCLSQKMFTTRTFNVAR